MKSEVLNLRADLKTWWLAEQHVVQGSSDGIDIALICDQMSSASKQLLDFFVMMLQAAVMLFRYFVKAMANLQLLW